MEGHNMKTLQVEVTQRDIDESEPMTCCKCPIALAINTREKGTYPRNDDASIHTKDGWFTRFKTQSFATAERYGFELPDAAIQFVADFEAQLPVKPISFILKLRPPIPRTMPNGTI